VALLLSRTGKKDNIDTDQDTTVGRDLKGLVGPWMYGDTRWKRRRLSSSGEQSVAPLDETPVENQKYIGWEEAFRWITRQARTSWKTAVRAIEQWDGPGDIDTGGYEEGAMYVYLWSSLCPKQNVPRANGTLALHLQRNVSFVVRHYLLSKIGILFSINEC
jgi:hypothetical protein